ncbi:unnamed protein product [Chironomus riparius]|uniref:RING-type domain-containing protein n=1 Tax=Chironomus riparius TaxID=315576 RepID=A0A9N9WP25_9DIPT|nr:unnamed protein product [Chironomus riparius]
MEDNPAPSTSGVNQSRNRRRTNRIRNRRTTSRNRSRSRNRPRSRRQILFVAPRTRSLSREQCERIARPSREEIQTAKECPICLETLTEDQPNRKLLCNHIFHESCLFPWVQGDIGNCPVCRQTLVDAY